MENYNTEVKMERYKAEVMRMLQKLDGNSTLWRTIYTLLVKR